MVNRGNGINNFIFFCHLTDKMKITEGLEYQKKLSHITKKEKKQKKITFIMEIHGARFPYISRHSIFNKSLGTTIFCRIFQGILSACLPNLVLFSHHCLFTTLSGGKKCCRLIWTKQWALHTRHLRLYFCLLVLNFFHYHISQSSPGWCIFWHKRFKCLFIFFINFLQSQDKLKLWCKKHNLHNLMV